MDLRTTYLGLELRNPLVASASPLSEQISNYRKLEDAGAAAVVNYSLFEEEIEHDAEQLFHHMTHGIESYAEAISFFPEPEVFTLRPDQYLEHIQRAKKAVDIPVIASLNGHTLGGWTRYAQLMEEAGADALELNLYRIPTDPKTTSSEIENEYLRVVKAVKSVVGIPVAVKLSPFFTAMANLASRLDEAGVNGLVLFNRFYQPDIDLENLEVVPNVVLSNSADTRLPMRWIAILFGRLRCSLASTSGIHSHLDVLKMMMAGADVTQCCSLLLKKGIGALETLLDGLRDWMEEHEYESIEQMKGSLSQRSCPDPSAFERANYIKALRSYHLV